ncbi:MAG TPA: YceI family protein [Bryobacteraceae bacterium]|nr:YceI family protein [Bryobacteraceae bacterium]
MQRNRIAIFALSSLAWIAAAIAQPRAIDTTKSVMTVHVYKGGAFSAFGHNHEISAPIRSGSADITGHHVELTVEASALRVRDTDASEKDRAEIQKTMLGPAVLDTERYREIVFRSTAAEPAGTGAWNVSGALTLHGQTKTVAVRVSEKAGHYIGQVALKQTDFGMKPVKVGGGAVKVKDEIRIEFDIQLAR